MDQQHVGEIGSRTSWLARALDRAYRRWGLVYLAAPIVAMTTILAAFGMVTELLYLHYQGVSPAVGFWWSLPVIGITAVAGLGVAGLSFWRHRDLVRWIRDKSETPANPEEFWVRATGAARELRLWVPVTILVISLPGFLIVVTGKGMRGAADLLAGAAGALAFAAVAALIIDLVVGLGFRPVLADLSRSLPRGSHPDRGGQRGLARRLLAVMCLTIFLGGAVVAAVSSPPGEGAERILIMLALCLAFALTLGLPFVALFTESIVGPVRALVDGTVRVAAGSFDEDVPVVTRDELGLLVRSFNQMQAGLAEREALHSAMGAYIDPAITERVMAEGSAIRGEAAEVTVMFVDIVGFTSMAEGAVPEEVVSDLNDFFALVIPVIVESGGHANKLLGDGLMAVFGVPTPYDDHADRALAAARQIQALLAERYEGQLKAGIGLNSGTVVVGSMGGGPKLDYTIIGDAVNVAARVEAYTRQTGDGILLTDTTKALLTNIEGLVSRGAQALKGRAAAVELWAPGGVAA